MARAKRPPRLHACNVLLDGAGRSRLWSFTGSDARSSGTLELPADRPLPAQVVGKGWAQLARPRANTAWIGDQRVFLQLVHLPTDDPAEVPAMLELQIEKLSPLPLAQIVWAFETLPHRSSSGLSVLVVLAERSGVESFLGTLERRGFDADRVESPLLQLVAGTPLEKDGAYVFAAELGGRRTHLIGWVTDGALRCLNVVNLADGERGARQLVEELHRLAWAGEIEGWTSGTPAVHLVADAALANAWREPLEQALGGARVDVLPLPDEPALAAASAARLLGGQPRANLIPPEFAARYRQQFADRLWMGGLAALFGAYLVGVLIYLGAVEVQRFRQDRLATDLAQVNAAYTNTLRIKAQTQVLQETVNLRYAALDCWIATVEAMPEELTLDKLVFSGGQSLQIDGTAPVGQEERITEFWQSLRRKSVGNTNLFNEVQLRPTSQRIVQGTPVIQWSFTCRLQRTEI